VQDGKFVDPRHAGASLETESRHPVRSQEPPPGYGRVQIIGLAVFLGVPLLIYVLTRLF
jgi:hypothetical protein